MKRGILIVFVMVACNTEKPDVLQESITEFVQTVAHDPSSYQPVSTVAIDTFYNDAGAVCAYEFVHTCRMKNKMGALVKDDFYVQTDANLKVYRMVNNRNQRWLTPCRAIENQSGVSK